MSTPWYVKARGLLAAKGIQHQELAQVLCVTKGTVSNWLSGRHQPTISQLRKIADVTGVSLTELLEDDDGFVRTQAELRILRSIRQVPDEKRDQAENLISALLVELSRQEKD